METPFFKYALPYRVPQGSILDPILFFIDSFPENKKYDPWRLVICL